MSECDHMTKIAVLETQLVGLREAISLQAREYERRLQELNHAHQNQMDRNAQYISREAWEIRNAEIDKWRREIDMWRWVSIGAGIVGGGLGGIVGRMLLR